MSEYRGMSEAMQTEVAKSANKPLHLVSVQFSGVTVYLSDAPRIIVFDGQTYIGLGVLLGFSDINEAAELQVASVTCQLSGITQTMISAFLSERYLNRPLKIHRGFFDANEVVVVDPVLIFDGHMDRPTIEDNPKSGKSVVTIIATNQWSDFERTPGRHTNHEEQQIWFSGDKGFEFAPQVMVEITWGVKAA